MPIHIIKKVVFESRMDIFSQERVKIQKILNEH